MLDHDAIRDAMRGGDWQYRAYLRAIFRRSLYAFTKFVVCFNEPENLMDVETFKESCDWLQWIVTERKRGLFEDPRGCIKTTRSTRSIPPWCAIQRPDERYDFPEEYDRAQEWLKTHPNMKGPDGRYVIGSDSKERAADFVGSTKTDWETNIVLRWCFPELLWSNYNRLPYGEWSRTGYTLNGRLNRALPDPFMTAVGIDSKSQGGRAEGIIIDDLVGETSYKSAAELQRRKDWLKTIGFLLENRDWKQPAGGFVLVVGNRWSLDDVNSDIHNNYSDWEVWHRSCYRCTTHGTGNCGRWDDNTERICAESDDPLWQGRYPDTESLERVERDVTSAIFAAQFRNDPTAEAELDHSNFRYCRVEATTVDRGSGEHERAWAVVIPNYNDEGQEDRSKPPEVIALDALQAHIISIDPASSKDTHNARTAVSWFAYDKPTGRVFWLDCRAGHWESDEATSEAYKLIVDAENKLGARPRVLIEKVAAQSYFSSALKFMAMHRKHRISDPEMIPPKYGVAKDDRIRLRVGGRLNQGMLYLRSGLQLPKWEVRHFPTGTKDALDTLVQAEEIFLEMLGTKKHDRLARARKRKRIRRIAAGLNDRTGAPI